MPRILISLPLLVALLVGCRASPPATALATGSAQVIASANQSLATSELTRVTVTVSAAGIPSVTIELAKTEGVWGGVIGDIPAGANRAFLAQAFDATGTMRYEGRVDGVTVVAGAVTLVRLTLQETSSPAPYTNEAPIIDAVVASPLVVAPGANVTLTANAHDPNPADTMIFSWTAPLGSFAAPTSLATYWTAPTVTGPVPLRLTVSDSRGATSSMTIMVSVTAGEGGAVVDVDFNNPPEVVSLTSSQSYLNVGQQTTLSASASDVDGDSLTYVWSTTCAGTFNGVSTSTARFTPTELPTASCNNCRVIVAVSDGRGGQTTGTLALCVSESAAQHLPPTVVRSYQSSLTANQSQQLTFEVVASDPEGSALAFSWSSNAGSLGARTNGATSSRALWVAPSCVSGGITPAITATITNGFGLTATKSFSVTGLQSCSGWASTGSMASIRAGHAATLLPDGRVLVTGGGNTSADISGELYDPVSGTWSATGDMILDRSYHTMTLLPNGKVLAVGGASTYHSFEELYDPVSGTWSRTGSMAMDRTWHTATRLPNGKVLIVGGYHNGHTAEITATAELYDPVSGTWSSTSAMSTPRYNHAATLLPNGRVLVMGGFRHNGDPLASAELYDPASGTWSSTGSMGGPRAEFAATLLLNGKVLVAGGNSWSDGLATAELYDPASGTWSSTGSMAFDLFIANDSVALLADGKVLITASRGPGNPSQLYDPVSGTWGSAGYMVANHHYFHTTTVLQDGKVLVAGGFGDNYVATAELYTP